MRLSKYLFLAMALVGFVPSPANAQMQKAAWFCSSVPDQNPIYVSSVWEKMEAQEEITLAFQRFLAAEYGYKSITMCGGADSSQNANAVAVEEETKAGQIAAWRKAGMKVVETGWTNAQPKSGPATPHLVVCSAGIQRPAGRQPQGGPFEMYVSAPFNAGDATITTVEAAFAQFLGTSYGISTTDLHPQCLGMGDEAQALGAIRQWTATGNARGKTVDTAWKMQN